MKWILGYAAGAMVLLAPVCLRVLLRSEAAPLPVDVAMAREGQMLFAHEWTVHDPLCPTGDGLGPVFNATSCAQCHFQGGLGGSGLNENNVTTFFRPANRRGKTVQGVIHAFAISPEYQENLTHASPDLAPLERPTLEQIRKAEQRAFQVRCGNSPIEISQRNSPALFGAKLIDEMPEQVILANERYQKLRWRDPSGQSEVLPVGRSLKQRDGRIGRFGWKAQSSDLLSFVQAACANELGLGNPGQAQPVPLAQTSYKARGLDLTTEQCEQMAAFIANLPRPVELAPKDARGQERVARGRQLFSEVGCADCHVPNMGSVEGVYSDFLVHRMGSDLIGGGSYFSPPPDSDPSPGSDPLPDEWRTPALWGVADSAPYLHDGRAATLTDAIQMHGGQARATAERFRQLRAAQQQDVIQFLKSLRAPG